MHTQDRKEVTAVLGIWLLALVVRLFFLAAFAAPLTEGGGDQTGYHSLALHIISARDFSEPSFIFRTPGFPLALSILYKLFGIHDGWPGVWFNLILSTLTAPLTFYAAQYFTGQFFARLTAGMLIALDPASAYLGVLLLSEPLHTFILTLALLSFCGIKQPGRSLLKAGVCGLLIGCASLVRPITLLYQWVAAGVAWFCWRKKPESLVLLLAGTLLVGGWMAHNYSRFGIFEFSTAGTHNLLFYRAAGIMRRVSGEPAETIERRFVREIEQRLENTPQTQQDGRYIAKTTADKKTLQMMRTMAYEIFASHPVWYLLMIPAGIVNMYGYVIPSPLWLKYLEILCNVLLYICAAGGWWMMLRQKQYDRALLIGATIVYFTLLTTATLTSGCGSRYRVPYTPLIAIAAGMGIEYYIRIMRNRLSGEHAER